MRKISLHNAFLIQLISLGIISVFTIGALWIFSETAKFEKETAALKNEYISTQKAILKREADRALMFVKYMKSQTEDRLQSSIKRRVYEAHAIASNIYLQNAGQKSMPEIKTMIKDALRPIRFQKGRGYFFAFNLSGIETLFPVKPEMEGKSMLAVTGGNGEYVVPDMLAIIQKDGEGFYKYTWPKPGQEGFYPKIAFVKVIKPIGWVIGTGEYLDDVERDIKKECIDWISNIRFGRDGYVFAGQWDGMSLSGPAAGKNMLHVEDINGVKIVRELIAAARSGGGFVEYVLPKFEGKKHAAKLSYSAGLPEWQWYVGSGMYVDEIEQVILTKRSTLRSGIYKNVQKISIILFLIFGSIIVFVRFLAGRIRKNLDEFTRFFTQATEKNIRIEKDSLHFLEFDQLAELANTMVQKQKEADKELQASHERFLTVLDGMNASVYVMDVKTHEILFMNKFMKETFGGDFTGEFCWKITRGRSEPCTDCPNEKLLGVDGETGGMHVWQYQNPINNRWYVNHDRLIKWTDGRQAKLQIATDMTDFKKLEEELRQAHKMESIGILAGGIAHDFNNILSIIVGNVELALDGLPKSNPSHSHVREIKAASLRAKDVVRQLLSYSRKSDQTWTSLDPAAVVKEALKLVRSSIPSHIDIRHNIPDNISRILGDATQIHQVIINLCTNAAQSFQNDQGVIEIDLQEKDLDKTEDPKFKELAPGKYIEIVVRDSGAGIDPAVIDRIFDPYFTTKSVGEGTGMGLAVVHGIVQNHDGVIFVESTEGQGSEFHMLFPVTQMKTEQKAEPSKEQVPAGNEKILFIDDEKALADMAEKVLRKLGYRVEVFVSPTEAFDRFEKDQSGFDLIITDMAMPRMSGTELAKKIRALRPDIPVIVCTGHADMTGSKLSPEIDIDAVEIKPVPMNRMARTIRSVLEKRNKKGSAS